MKQPPPKRVFKQRNEEVHDRVLANSTTDSDENGTTHIGYWFVCPWCGKQVYGMQDVVADETVGLAPRNFKVVIDNHLIDSPTCKLRKFAP